MATVIETTGALAAEPEGPYEVIGSVVVKKPRLGAYEAGVASLLLELMAPFTRANGLGQVIFRALFDLRPAVDRQRRPDLAVVSDQTWPIGRRGPRASAWKVVPDLAIEVISPTNRATDVLAKVREYLQAGSRLVWVVYPIEAEIHVFAAVEPSIVRRLGRGDILDGGAVVPGFQLPLDQLFEEEDSPTD